MKRLKISIIVPVYNVEQYIQQCLNSLVNQTYNNLEIILVNDGSIDNSGKICDEYAQKDRRIKVIHQKNSGVSSARNNGLNMVTGDYIMFIDPDDWIEVNACERLIKILKKDNLDVLIFNYYKEYLYNSEKHKLYDYKNSNGKTLIYSLQAKILSPSIKISNFNIQGIGFTWNKIIATNVIKNQRFLFEGKKALFEDVLFYYDLFEKTNIIGVCNEYLYHYRVLGNSATRRYNEDFLSICDEFFENINSLRYNHINDNLFKKSLNIRIVSNFCTAINVYFNNENLKVGLLQKRKMIKKELKKNYYKHVFKEVKLKDLNKKLKVYTILLRFKAYICVLLVNNIEKRLRERMYNYGSNFSNL